MIILLVFIFKVFFVVFVFERLLKLIKFTGWGKKKKYERKKIRDIYFFGLKLMLNGIVKIKKWL